MTTTKKDAETWMSAAARHLQQSKADLRERRFERSVSPLVQSAREFGSAETYYDLLYGDDWDSKPKTVRERLVSFERRLEDMALRLGGLPE